MATGDDTAAIAALPNLGPASARMLARAGITTVAQLEEIGAVEAFRRVQAVEPSRATVVLLYALEGALWDTHWNELPPERREQLLREVGREDLI